jgi:hypothetical protein
MIALIENKLDKFSSDECGIAHMFIRYLTAGQLSPEPMIKGAR